MAKRLLVAALALSLLWGASGCDRKIETKCKDGTVSHSGGRRGACSGHGGVDRG